MSTTKPNTDNYPGLVPGDDPAVLPALAGGLPTVYHRDEVPAQESYFCGVCMTKHIRYRHSFNEGLAVFLGRLFDAQGPAKTADLGLTHGQYTNIAKTRYWGLAAPHENEESAAKRGWWEITDFGKAFVIGAAFIQETVLVRDDIVTGFEGPVIAFQNVSAGYQYHADYAEQVRQEMSGKKLNPIAIK